MTKHDKEEGLGQVKNYVKVFVRTLLDCLSGDDFSSSVSLSVISQVLYLCTVSNSCAIFI